jgi:sortase A
VFWISVLGEDHRYQVMSTETVLPNETDSLKIVPGEDWVTLFTCTPIGVNSHRFMVHAKRIADTDDSGGESLGGIGAPGFPWWAVWFVGGSAVTGWIILTPPRKRRATRGTGRCR